MPPLIQISLFSKDPVALASFYQGAFGLKESVELHSEIFRGVMAGDVLIGISAPAAYDLLNLTPRRDMDGDQTALTLGFGSLEEMETAIRKAVDLGAELVKPVFRTYYGWDLAVLRDPDGNAVRLAVTQPG